MSIPGGAPIDQRDVANSTLSKALNCTIREVELSGLEPLTSCMPCRPIPYDTVAGRPAPARQATCGVRRSPALAIAV